MVYQKAFFALLAGLVFVAPGVLADPSVAPPPPTSNSPQATGPEVTPSAPAAAKPPEESYSYVTGYSDGCASANLRYARQEHVKPNRDPKLYDTDTDYRAGWDRGYRKCEDKVTPGGLSVPGNSVVL